ncbi:MAG: DUF998 domain-containing protein [Chloroflexi bacterium]|nr:MAG: DUF998 domain-containing protein [Chloroflexota bacterium]
MRSRCNAGAACTGAPEASRMSATIRRRGRSGERLNRSARVLGIAAPPIAVVTVLVAGAVSPGYDPLLRTVSRLAVPGMPAAAAVDLSIGLIGLACFGLASGLVRGAPVGRVALTVSGLAFLGAAVVHLDPASAGATAMHRLASALAVVGLTVAPLALARAYGPVSFAVGVAELAMLVIGLGLLATSFDGWGAWERLLLAIPLAWMVLMAVTIDSTDETISAKSASLSRSGS